MIRTIATAIAAASITFFGAGLAHADTSADVAAQCARATIKPDFCSGGSVTGIDGADGVLYAKAQPARSYVANIVPGTPILDKDGNVVRDRFGDALMTAPVTVMGTVPADEPGKANSDGQLAINENGYQPK